MSIEMYIGPMYAGKTSKLIEMYKGNANLSKIVIDYDLQCPDKKRSNVVHSSMKSHDDVYLDNVYCMNRLMDIMDVDRYQMFSEDVRQYYFNMFNNSKHIYINECQFFPDLKEFCLKMASYGKCVHLYGLDSDFKQERFGEVYDMIPYCSTVQKLTGKCDKCEAPSVISHRVVQSDQQYLPDEKAYIPLCLQCSDALTY